MYQQERHNRAWVSVGMGGVGLGNVVLGVGIGRNGTDRGGGKKGDTTPKQGNEDRTMCKPKTETLVCEDPGPARTQPIRAGTCSAEV